MNCTRITLVFCIALSGMLIAGEGDAGAKGFDTAIRPLLKEYCLKCHSTAKHKGDLDLERFSSLGEVKKQSKIWQGVAEQLANGEMPPAKETQLPAADKERLSKWVRVTLDEIALAHAGDPGPVVLRRLSNAEYTYTIRDLTGVESLDPAREFPVDGAGGEGFTNTGQSLVMSPSLITKYLDAGKDIATHAVLLPDGMRFSAKTTRRDRTEDLLAEIRGFYREYTDPRGGAKVNLQGIIIETNTGGRLPLEKYLAATLTERSVDTATPGLSNKYYRTLFNALSAKEPSLLLDGIRARWRAAKPGDAAALTAEIGEWQNALWKFNSVGHIGKLNGPKMWLEPVTPLVAKQESKLKIPASTDGKDVTLYLATSDAGDGNEHDFAVWQEPRLIAPGRATIMLKDVREFCREQAERRERVFGTAAKTLAAAANASAAQGTADVAELAKKHGVDSGVLAAWLDVLGQGSGGPAKIEGYFTNKLTKASGFDFINGWGVPETPNMLANSSDKDVRVPGEMKPHSIAVHPSPKLMSIAGWRSPINGTVTVDSVVQRVHPECGNGIVWFLDLRRGGTRQRLGTGTITDRSVAKTGPIANLSVRVGDVISLSIDPRGNDHSCDLTFIDLTVNSTGEKPQKWNLAADVSPDVLAGNPHADSFGNKDVWHFYSEPIGSGAQAGPVIPAGSLLARWQSAANAEEKNKLAEDVQKLLLTGQPPAGKDNPDAALYKQLTSLGGPLLSRAHVAGDKTTRPAEPTATPNDPKQVLWGLDPALFGRHPNGQARDAGSICVHAPSVIEIHLPAELAAGCEFVTTGVLDKETGAEGSVQMQVLTSKPTRESGLLPIGKTETQASETWTSNNQRIAHAAPIIVNDGSQARARIEAAFDAFRQLFPAALCYAKIVPVDEVVTLTLYHREDNQLARLMLDDAQKAKLDRLWNELHYISQDALSLVDAFDQIWQFSTQDGDPKALEPLREPIKKGAADFRQWLVDTEPKHVDAVIEFAGRAYRRPMTEAEKSELRGLYRKLRAQELPHDQSIRLTLARVLVAPAFLYRAENPPPGKEPGPVNDFELANRLSYFLWASMPDAELSAAAASGKLHEPAILAAQTQRMLRDPRVRRMATEFACSWLHIHGFDELGENSERHFPTFVGLRGAMYEESIQFFTDFFQSDRPVLSILNADYTYLNEALAKHYGIPGVSGAEFRRVEGIKKYSRGGILTQASTLAKQSGASRTSPILRGNWVAEALLGDKLPRPPKDVPPFPEDVDNSKLTVRELTVKHTSDARCAGCHARIDSFGFSLEAFDAIGRRRERDAGGLALDTHAKTLDGAEFEGVDGLREYLMTKRLDAFLRQFNRKLLGYALARSVQLSDEPLLKELQEQIKSGGPGAAADKNHIGVVIDKIVQSSQFRNIRGRDASNDE